VGRASPPLQPCRPCARGTCLGPPWWRKVRLSR
jgi:hypothetical protein